jgi:hypothetical protein
MEAFEVVQGGASPVALVVLWLEPRGSPRVTVYATAPVRLAYRHRSELPLVFCLRILSDGVHDRLGRHVGGVVISKLPPGDEARIGALGSE